MNSFNHYAFGAVADWMHRYLAGLAPATPGYRQTLIHVRPTDSFTWARASHESPYGHHLVAWDVAEGRLRVRVEIPVNTTAEVVVPAARTWVLVDGRMPDAGHDGVIAVSERAPETMVLLGSGAYLIEAVIATR